MLFLPKQGSLRFPRGKGSWDDSGPFTLGPSWAGRQYAIVIWKFVSIPHTGLKKKKTESNGCHSEIRNIECDIINFICFSAVAHYKIDVPMKKKETLCKVSWWKWITAFHRCFHFKMEYYDGAKTFYHHYSNLHTITSDVYILRSWNVFELIIT